ncbi:MAG: acyl-CoA thioesterase [Planctomycetes bacterium]|nr:acyl-CoA thioesterase [Planctomycetota bacterium]
MPDVFDYPLVVSAAEIDDLGHANNVAYLHWMQAAALAHSAAQGWPPERYQQIGTGWVVRSHRIEYLRPALEGHRLVVRTWVATMKKVSSERRYEILRHPEDLLLAKAATEWVFVNYRTGIPARVPPEVLGAFTVVERVDG